MKNYLYYLKKSKKLYAFTSVKEYDKLFRSQRNMKVFTRVVLDMKDHYDIASFRNIAIENKMDNMELNIEPLSDGRNEIDIAMTRYEYVSVMESCDYIENFLYSLRFDDYLLSQIDTKGKKAIIKLTDLDIDGTGSCHINLFRIFYKLFDFTFNNDIDSDTFRFYDFN